MRLSTTIAGEIKNFNQEVTLSSGVTFDYRETLKKINLHKRQKFLDCSDSDAVFWGLGVQRAPHFAKKVDADTRHFMVEGYGDFNYQQAWATNIRFKKWARDTEFALDLDDFGDALTDFGSCAIKLVERQEGGYDLEEIDLMKLWFDPTIKEFRGQTKIELHELEKHKLENMKGWDNVDKAWEKAETSDNKETEKSDTTNQVAEKRKFYERVGWFNIAYYKGGNISKGKYEESPEKDKWKFMHTIHAGTGDDEVILYSEEIKEEDDIYRDLHIGKYEDRWLRIGVYERLFEVQRLINESVNYDKQAQQISSLLLFKLKAGNKRLVGSNIFQEAKSGLITDAELEQVGITNTYLGEFINKLAIYEQKADQLCMTPDVLTGEGSDAKTFRGHAALTNVANSAFKKIRDRFCGVISDILVRKILPYEMKKWNKEKTLEISGFEIDNQIYDAMAMVSKLNEWLGRELKKGNNPSAEEKQVFMERMQEQIDRDGRQLILPEKYYDFDFGLAQNPTGEVENKEQMNDVYFNIIQMILANPAINLIPTFREYCEKNGITPFHLNQDQMQQLQQGQTQQGQQGQAQPVAKKDALMSKIDTN